MNNKIISKIKIDNANDKNMATKILISYLVSVGEIAHIRGGGLYVKGQEVWSYNKALSILNIEL